MIHYDLDLLQAAHSEDLLYDQISKLAVLGTFEKKLLIPLSRVVHICYRVHVELENQCS